MSASYRRDIRRWREVARDMSWELQGFYAALVDELVLHDGRVQIEALQFARLGSSNARAVGRLIDELVYRGRVIRDAEGWLSLPKVSPNFEDSPNLEGEVSPNFVNVETVSPNFDETLPEVSPNIGKKPNEISHTRGDPQPARKANETKARSDSVESLPLKVSTNTAREKSLGFFPKFDETSASGARSLPREAHAPLAPPAPPEQDWEPVRTDIGYSAPQQPGRTHGKQPGRNPGVQPAPQQPGRTHGVKTGPLDADDMARLRQWRHDVMRDADLNDRTAGKPAATGAPDRPTAFQQAWAKYQAGDRLAFLPGHEAPIMGGSALRAVIREQLNLPPVPELSEELAGKLTSGGIENSPLYRRAMANDTQTHANQDNGAELPGHEPAQAGAGQAAHPAGPGTGQVAPVSAAGAARHPDHGEHDDGARQARDAGGYDGLTDEDIDQILKF